MVIISIVLLLIAGIAKSVQDTLAHHYSSSIFSDKEKYNPVFWNPKLSWMNKYPYDPQTGKLDTSKERFFGSTTILVAFTDAWHLFQLISINLLGGSTFLLALLLCDETIGRKLIALIAALVIYKTVFQIFYKYIWISSK
jgi:hypothetical protein